MVLSRPIPKALLPHTVTLKTPRNEGVFSDGEYDDIILYNVRVEQDEKVRQSKSGESRVKGARMYFDCVNSSPADIDFKSAQLIVFCGVTYKIEAVKTVMAADKIHHYRIDII
ncbi:MAG: minor capsid protein [Oscillospiraceae bacterium]|nr:minor capsid protein [Oscillospiraceae bacterium]